MGRRRSTNVGANETTAVGGDRSLTLQGTSSSIGSNQSPQAAKDLGVNVGKDVVLEGKKILET